MEEWQTRTPQKRLPERACGFESRSRHRSPMMIHVNSYVTVTRHDLVAEIVLDRVAAHNALSTEMMADLATAAVEVGADEDVRAVFVTSTAPNFCVGADLKERAGLYLDGFHGQRAQFRSGFEALRALPMPVVAAVHGYALGGGY